MLSLTTPAHSWSLEAFEGVRLDDRGLAEEGRCQCIQQQMAAAKTWHRDKGLRSLATKDTRHAG